MSSANRAISTVALEGPDSIDTRQKFGGDALRLVVQGSGNASMAYEGNAIEAVIDGSGNIHLSGLAKREVLPLQILATFMPDICR